MAGDQKPGDDDGSLTKMERELVRFIEVLRRLGMAVQDMNAETITNDVVPNYVNGVVDHLRKLDNLKNEVTEDIPRALIGQIEAGRNPDMYTKDLYEQVSVRNQQERGKIVAVKNLRDTLTQELRTFIPSEEFDLHNTPPAAEQKPGPSPGSAMEEN
ncbi:hypothetical protein M427DRAFT_64640 [Gonapodya prolifera JEL478]|uniref:Mediator of RNA polymerase II transcription subunit 10 n=1 Tax=Gonapodya prolifera (strain JEL478) TaxID=1344416 RepID=A0A138ZXF2_GONPJ|nr:hypothetical protein M427DRAFT_64640 [Gonapodya prolifera JEL478]|eukprot:KXS09178.1 hypothetical protein M427DRAFT_64640 [Gonapodya prolifera JEL478]